MRSKLTFYALSVIGLSLLIFGCITLIIWRGDINSNCRAVVPNSPLASAEVGKASQITIDFVEPKMFPGPYHFRFGVSDCCLDIAHAGGSFKGVAYTNSYEALERNYHLGRQVFEIDFAPSCEGEIVLAHGWGHRNDKFPTVAEFRLEGTHGNLSAMTLLELIEWLRNRPNAQVITDTKYDTVQNSLLHHLVAASSSGFVRERFIFQVYSESEMVSPKFDGYRKILTVYKMKNKNAEELRTILTNASISALAIPESFALRNLQNLRQNSPNLPIYIHGTPARINSLELQEYLKQYGASGFYQE